MRKRPSKAIFYGLLVLLPLAVCLALYGYRHHIRDFYQYFSSVPISRVEVARAMPGETLRLTRQDGISLAATLFRPEKPSVQGAVLLLHGNIPIGRQHPMYRLVASKLAGQGFLVLTLDFAGYGDSGDPFSLGTTEALDPKKDVRAGLDYLQTLPEIKEKSIYVIGHSGGCPSGMRVGIADPSVAGMIAIGPPRRVRERLTTPEDRDAFWKESQKYYRSLYQRQFPEWYTKEMWVDQALSEGTSVSLQCDLHAFLPYFSQPNHKPLFLIDCELDAKEDKVYLREFFKRLSEPKDYLTLDKANHYLNTKAFKRWILYDQLVMDQLFDAVLDWLDEHSARSQLSPTAD